MERRKLGWPLLLIALGVIFLLKNVGLIDLNLYEILFSWPMILVAIGVVKLIDRSYVSGFILLFLGGIFMLPRMDIIRYEEIHIFWPVLLIVIGVALLFRRKGYRRLRSSIPEAIPTDTDGFVRIDVTFSASKTALTDPIFRGAILRNTFGSIDLDLRGTRLESPEVYIDLDCTFGGITLRLPPTWRVESRVDCTLGGFDDKRSYPVEGTAPGHVVIIRGSVTFGGVELRER